MRFILSSFVALALFVSGFVVAPVPAQAAGLTESQIQAIISLVASFGADATTVSNVSASLRGQATTGSSSAGGTTTSGSACIALSFDLYLEREDAQTNGEVTKLQQFLAQNSSIYPESRITGFFGPATQQAVQRWQKSRGIVSAGDPDSTGYGFVGAKTRAAMRCGTIPATYPTTNVEPIPTPWVDPAKPSCILTASSQSVTIGQQFTLSWTSKNAGSATLDPTFGSVAVNGSQQVTIGGVGFGNTSKFTLSVSGPNGTATCQVSVDVTASTAVPSASIDNSSLLSSDGIATITGSASNATGVVVALVPASYAGSKDWSTIYANHSYVTFTSPPPKVVNGRWSAWMPGLAEGTYTVLVYDHSYAQPLLTTGTLAVTAPKVLATTPVVNLHASSFTIYHGQETKLSWNTTNATHCVLQRSSTYDSGEENVAVNGSKTVAPTQSTTYRLACMNDGGTGKDGPSADDSLMVTVNYPTISYDGSEAVQVNKTTLAPRPNASFTITGWGSPSINSITVVLVGIKYADGNDWNSVSNALKDGSGYIGASKTVPISGGTWSASFGGLPEGYYHILIYDGAHNWKGGGFMTATLKG